MNRIATMGLVAGIAALLVGCGGSGNGLINVPNPRVRFANVLPSIVSAKSQVGSDTISAAIPFGSASDYAITPNGNKDLTVGDSTFSNLATLSNQLFETNKRYTGIGYGTTPRAILLLEENESNSVNDTVAIRAINANQAAPSLDVYISAPADSLPAAPAFNAVAVAAITTSEEVSSASGTSYRIRVYADGDTTTALVDKNITITTRDRVALVVYADAGQASGYNILVLKENQ
jgi:hypothetical protein